MSGCTDDEVLRNGALESDIEFLQKPFTVNALSASLRTALKGE